MCFDLWAEMRRDAPYKYSQAETRGAVKTLPAPGQTSKLLRDFPCTPDTTFNLVLPFKTTGFTLPGPNFGTLQP